MTVYIDVLIFVNVFINFFILRLASAIGREQAKILRILLASGVGALFSLYIFLPLSNFFTQTLVKIVTSAVVVFVAFRFDGFRPFLRRWAVFFIASFLFAGFMLGIWYLVKPQGMAVHNGVVYFNVSPTVLIGVTLVTYGVLSLLRRLMGRRLLSEKTCTVTLQKNGRTVVVNTLLDTGNHLVDCMDGAGVMVIDYATAAKLFHHLPQMEQTNLSNLPSGFRLIPVSTVQNSGFLFGFKVDAAGTTLGGEHFLLPDITVAIAKDKIGDGFHGIIGPNTILEKRKELRVKKGTV